MVVAAPDGVVRPPGAVEEEQFALDAEVVLQLAGAPLEGPAPDASEASAAASGSNATDGALFPWVVEAPTPAKRALSKKPATTPIAINVEI
ncbi:MAG: hypothetical protein ACREEC_01720 [Thermoplasmata archaeon]